MTTSIRGSAAVPTAAAATDDDDEETSPLTLGSLLDNLPLEVFGLVTDDGAAATTTAVELASAPTTSAIFSSTTPTIGDGDEEDSPLLGPSLEDLPAGVLERVLLPLLDPIDRTMFAQVSRGCRAAVAASGLPRATGRVRLHLRDYVGSVERFIWAWANGCPWNTWTSKTVAEGGNLQVLRWAREEHHCPCPWDWRTCAWAAQGGHLEVLKWAREHDCPWDEGTCACAASGGHLEILKWARDHDCPWDEITCACADGGGHLEVLRWAVENHCPGAGRYAHHLT